MLISRKSIMLAVLLLEAVVEKVVGLLVDRKKDDLIRLSGQRFLV